MRIYLNQRLCNMFEVSYLEGAPEPFTANPHYLLLSPFSNWDREHTSFLNDHAREAMTLRLEAVRHVHQDGHTYHQPGWYIANPLNPNQQEN